MDEKFSTGGGLKGAADLLWKEQEQLTGQVIGSYQLTERIGKGGMGVVYRARPADGRLEREVAIKLLPSGPLLRDLAERFSREAEIQSRMSHPNITRLYDAGVSDRGLPFLVMEFVDGEPIDTYCERRELSVEQRVQLIREVAAGIASAHANLVLHCDIKPSNVLIDAEGQPKLLDFGIAMLLDDQSADVTLRTMALTPAYASPEQLTGKRASVATDVYQLGLLLYKVLAGESLYAGEDVASAIERVVRDDTVRLPPDSMSRISKDLQAIILKSIQTDPAARYSDVNAFSEDLRRYLEGFPIAARTPRWWTPATKLIRRNAGVSGAFAVLLIALVMGNFLYLTALLNSREEARNEAQRATAVTEFLVGTFEASAPGLPGAQQVTAEELLQAGAESLETQLHDQPALRAEILYTVGRLYMLLGQYEQSETFLRESLAIGESVHGAEHESLVDVHKALGQLLRLYLQQREQAVMHLGKAMEIHREHYGLDAEYAQLLSAMANEEIYGWQRYEVALDLLQQAQGIQDRLLDPRDADRLPVLTDLMNVHVHLGNLETAEQFGRRALALAESNFGPMHVKVHNPLYYLARVLVAQGRMAEAVPLFERDLELVHAVYGKDHGATASVYLNLANALRRAGRSHDALPAAQEALAIYERTMGKDHSRYASAATLLAALLQETGSPEDAEPLLLAAVATYEATVGRRHTNTAYGVKEYGDYLFRAGRLDEARVQYIRAHEIWQAVSGDEHPDTALLVVAIGSAELALGNLEQAESLFLRALAVQQKALSPDHPRLAETLSFIGSVRVARGQGDACREPLQRALEIRQTVFSPDHPTVREAQSELETCLAIGN